LFRNCILFILKGNCDSFDSLLDFCFIFIVQFLFAPQMWATRPHLASIFEKLLEQKTFYLPAAWNWKLFIFSSVFRQLFTKSRICAKMKTIEKNRRQKT